MQTKIAQQNKQMRVGAREGFPYSSVKLFWLANGDRYEFDSNTLFPSGKALYPFRILPCPAVPTLTFLTSIHTCSLWSVQLWTLTKIADVNLGVASSTVPRHGDVYPDQCNWVSLENNKREPGSNNASRTWRVYTFTRFKVVQMNVSTRDRKKKLPTWTKRHKNTCDMCLSFVCPQKLSRSKHSMNSSKKKGKERKEKRHVTKPNFILHKRGSSPFLSKNEVLDHAWGRGRGAGTKQLRIFTKTWIEWTNLDFSTPVGGVHQLKRDNNQLR